MVETIKFSEMTAGGDLANDDKVPGLLAGGNVLFNNPWTFLADGTTGDRPVPTPAIYYRLRFNTTLTVYEYFDPLSVLWVQLSGTGTGTVNPGTANDIAFYAANGTAISPVASAANAVLVSNGSQVPSMSTTLPTGLSIPGAVITASTSALLSGSVVAAPVAGIDLTNKTYVDSLFSSGVTAVVGTTNQVLANGVAAIPQTGAVTLSLPQDIALGSTPTFAGLTLTSIPLGETSGGTGESTYTLGDTLYSSAANTLSKLAGNTTVVKQYLSQTGDGAVSAAPSWATISGGDIIGAALTKVDDANVTLTLGGTPAAALLRATSLTLGWTGQLGLTRGGSNASLTASNGGIVYSTATAMAILAGTATAGQMLQSGSSASPAWSTATFPTTATSTGTILRANGTNWVPSTSTFADTYSASTLLYSNGANTVTGLATANSSVLITSSTGVPSMSGALANGQLIIGSTGASPVVANLTAGSGISISNTAGGITISGTGSGTGFTEVTGTTQAMVADTGYVSNNAGLVTLTLPATAAFGTAITVVGKGAGGWKIAQNASQLIHVGNQVTTTGAGGSLASTNQFDSIDLVCVTANTVWVAWGAPQSSGLTFV